MKRWAVMAVVGAILLAGQWAVAGETSEWFEAVHRLEVKAEWAEESAALERVELEELDHLLGQNLADADTAVRATEGLRQEVAKAVAQWDRASRSASRQAVSQGPGQGLMAVRAVEQSGWPATEAWKRQVRLLGEVDRGLDYGEALMVERAQVTRLAAQQTAVAAAAEEEKEQVRRQAREEADASELAAEIESTAQALGRLIEGLDSRQREGDFHRLKGTLRPPIDGQEPDHGFGPRQREGSFTENRHTGLTYMVGVGTTVRAVAEGTVVMAERMPGFGKLVIVDHGDDYHSIYAHLSDFEVDVGDELARREEVGASGESGSLEGPKFYFEFRQRGQPIDPAPWFIQH